MSSDPDGSRDYRQFPVLYVDDEVSNLRAFELAFRREFSILKAESGTEALAQVASAPIAVVLSDHRMPGMTGTEFLARVREIAPRSIRLLVTAYGDAATLAQAINDGCIYRYVPKPWEPGELRAIIRQSIDLFALEAQREELISELTTLNNVSQAIAKRLELDPLVACLERTIVQDLGFDGASVMLLTMDGDALSWHSSLPTIGELSGQNRAVTRRNSPSFFSLLEGAGAALLSLGAGIGAEGEVRTLLSHVAAEEMLVLPLHGRRGLLGALTVDNRRGGKRFAANDRHLLQGLAAQAATAIDNAQIVGELRNDAARTSGSDALAVDAALGRSMLREVRDPLRVAVGSDDGAIVAGAVARAAAAMDVFSEIVTEQRPVACELGELIQLARGATQGLSAGVGSNVTVTGNAAMKIEALPGRLAQLLVHLLEICIGRAPGGAVIVSLRDEIGGVTVEMSPVPGDAIDLQGGADGDEIHLLRLAACEALLRELGGSLELSDSAVGGGCCLRLGRSE